MADDVLKSSEAVSRVQKLFLPPKKRTRNAVLGERDREIADISRRECLRDALIAVYSGLDYNEERERIFGWAACVVHRLRSQMVRGLKDSRDSLSLTRTASHLAGIYPKFCYREKEMKEALKHYNRLEDFRVEVSHSL